jgi:2-methylisocitrate lyase-like PEP mutase family enzyme
MTQSEKAEQFRALHRGPAPLVLPNVWDAASVYRVTKCSRRWAES